MDLTKKIKCSKASLKIVNIQTETLITRIMVNPSESIKINDLHLTNITIIPKMISNLITVIEVVTIQIIEAIIDKITMVEKIDPIKIQIIKIEGKVETIKTTGPKASKRKSLMKN